MAKHVVSITTMVLNDIFFRGHQDRLGRFVNHWMIAIERDEASYYALPEDDDPKTHDLANRLNWICPGKKNRWYLTGPDKNCVWLRDPSPRSTSTYIVEAVGQGLVKIGRSRDPWARLSSLQTANPRELRMVAVLVGDVESTLHARHAVDRMGGEWFRFSESIRESIKVMDKLEPR